MEILLLSYKYRSVKGLQVRRGDIYYADLSPVVGSEQGGIRPVLIIQNDVGNKHSPTVICAAITSRMNKANDGNFLWGYSFAIFYIFVLSFVKWTQMFKKGLRFRIGAVFCGGVLLYQVFCGFVFFWRLMQGETYFMV